MKTLQRAGLGRVPYPTAIPSTLTVPTPANALITPKPELRKRSGTPLDVNDPRFIGWQTTGGEVYQRACDSGYTYSESGEYFNCCPITGDCSFANNCITYSESQFEVYPNGDTSICAQTNMCYFDYVYTATSDPSPKSFIGCATNYYHALRTANSMDAYDWDYSTPPRPSTISFAPELHPTATSDEIAYADHAIQLGGSFSKSWRITPLTAGVAVGVFAVVFVLCLLGRCKRNRNARKNARMNNPVAPRPRRPFFSLFGTPASRNFGNRPQNFGNHPQNFGNYPQNFGNHTQDYGNQPPPYDPVVFPQQHELTPIPINNIYDPRTQGLGGGMLGGGQSQYARLPGEEVQDGFSPNPGQTMGVVEGPGTEFTNGGGNR